MIADEVYFMLNALPPYRGSDLEEFRDELKLTNDDLASLFGCSKATIHRIKSKKSDVLSPALRGHLHFLRQTFISTETYIESAI
ncbi:helix-turn-helix domain-containing protein [Sulfitobacter sp. M22]|uniref:helix-turn-helix domain-containing protein n=1 Tax=Sulfitobacter sp. M22 TaxID=2675332 RepID=UPI001F18ABCA|nr:helix-turn-helix transcriptional regulator [Sulfitobacter sp. M22]MCF7728679.1 hypothetical protein [Sulfitobacter sp. M22]